MKKFIATILLGAAVSSVAGCSGGYGNPAGLDLAQVGGTVKVDGQPLSNAQVVFEDNDDKTYSYGVTDDSGRYRLRFDSYREGVQVGPKTVRIWTTKRGPDFDRLMKADYAVTESIGKRYNHQSTLQVVVEHSRSGNFDFELESGGETQNAVNTDEGE